MRALRITVLTVAVALAFAGTANAVVAGTPDFTLAAFTKPQPDGGWLLRESAGLESSLDLESVGISIPLAEIYARVTFPPAGLFRGEADAATETPARP